MDGFWEGFKLAAKKEEKEKGFGLNSLLRASGQMSGARMLAMPAQMAGNAVTNTEKAISLAEAKDLAEKIKKHRGLKTNVQFGGPMPPHYNPFTDKVHIRDPKAAVLAHELGHAASAGKVWRSGALGKTYNITRGLSHRASPFIPIAAIASGNEKLEDMAPYLGFGAALPTLIEEGTASAHALSDLKRFRGMKGFKSGLAPLAGAYTTYLAPVVASSLLAKYLIDKKRAANS